MNPGELELSFQDRCLQFGAAVLRYAKSIADAQGPNPRLRQLERCATSIGANIAESRSAQSRLDFISKFEIALKEARETDYWLRLLKAVETTRTEELGKLIGECWQITAILVSSIKTAKRNGGIIETRLQRGRATNGESRTLNERAESREQS